MGALAVGTATFQGSLAGTERAVAFAFYDTTPASTEAPADAGPLVHLYVTAGPPDTGNVDGPSLLCSFFFSGTALAAGQYTPANVVAFDCLAYESSNADQGPFYTGGTFVLSISSPGPFYTDDLGTPRWDDPTATLSVGLAISGADAGVSVECNGVRPQLRQPQPFLRLHPALAAVPAWGLSPPGPQRKNCSKS